MQSCCSVVSGLQSGGFEVGPRCEAMKQLPAVLLKGYGVKKPGNGT